jgi:hypothetical protein
VLGASVRPNRSAALSLGALNHLQLSGYVSPKSKETFYRMSIVFEVNCRRRLGERASERILDGSRCPYRRPICWSLRSVGGHHCDCAWHGRQRGTGGEWVCDIAWQYELLALTLAARFVGATTLIRQLLEDAGMRAFTCSVERRGTSIRRKSLCRSRNALLRLVYLGVLPPPKAPHRCLRFCRAQSGTKPPAPRSRVGVAW